ncbi:MAG TPA: efflux transporter outer membrane subunit [Candidatus Acidoferrum sp.]|jgi:NodT family efflux transporter outer membrane factor (OMF) lipoprotein|nr:efflux transporter outer membrane subunit [Candidatus Acidoferrum sp.]
MTNVRHFPALIGLAGCVFAAGCTVGPNYHRPAAPVPAQWDISAPWREGAPKDNLAKGEWWSVFHDDQLSALENQAIDANQTIKVAAAHLEQARASAALQIATQFPNLATAPQAERQRISGNRPRNSTIPVTSAVTQNSYSLPFTAGYEVDLFGRRRRSIEAARASYQATAADLENVRLVITAELAGDYFTLRQLDTELGILNRTVETLQKGLQLVDSRHKGGVASGLDVAQEETLLNTTRTQAILLEQQRKQFEDAIAVLAGKPAPDFHVAIKEINAQPPPLDAGLPSALLERRPDIAEAERQMAVANAQIGMATAAYYPSMNLFGNGGWQAADVAKLLNVQSTFWAVGANVAENIFTAGSRRAQIEFAKAGYDANVASYRQTVLGAFQEVQDDVTGLAVLEQAEQSQQQAVDAARRTLDIATSRYTGGLVSYLDVVNAQQNLLNNEQELAVIKGQKLVTSVLLIKALGGGWDASSLAAVQVKPKLKDVVAP